MKKKYRNIYFLIIVSITIVSIPLLLLYSAGYRWDWKKNKIIKTGSLYVAAIPKNAEIYINDELRTKKTPLLINNLLPGEYAVSCKKDGYYSWEKKLLIETQKTNFATNVILFKKTTPEKIDKGSFPQPDSQEPITTEIAAIFNQLKLSNNIKITKLNNSQYVILDKNKKKLLLTEKNDDALNVENISDSANGFSLSQNKNQILYFNAMEIWKYDIKNKSKKLITRQSEEINEAIWLTDYYVIFSEDKNIKAIELDSRDHQQIYTLTETNEAKNIFLDKKNKILYFQADNSYWELLLN